jgi:hypothetical protein
MRRACRVTRLFLIISCVSGVTAAATLAGSASGQVPLERVDSKELLQLAYPDDASPGTVRWTNVWKGEGAPRLLALFDKDGSYEIAAFAQEGEKLRLLARYVETDRWDDAHGFDLAPYRVARDRVAIGVRYQTMQAGGTAVVLKLYLRADATFRPIFERRVSWQSLEGDESNSAVIQLAPGAGEYKDLVVLETQEGRTARERWSWDAAARAYREAPR